MLKKIHIDFDFEKIRNADHFLNSSSCIKHQLHELTDVHDMFGGFPKSYCLENTKIHQLWWTADDIDFHQLGKQLGIEVITVSSILQEPGCVIPLHRDTFYQIVKNYPERKELKVRANIYLEDYKLGQFIQYQDGDSYSTSTNWLQGDGYIWDSSVLHLSANAGMENKYTLQVSGFLMND